MIKGGRLSFSTEHLLAIDTILRERLQPISRYGWVVDQDGSPVSSCGSPVTELTVKIGDLARSVDLSKRVLTGLSTPVDGLACPLVVVQIEPLGLLLATCAGATISANEEASLVAIADLLGPIFEAARG